MFTTKDFLVDDDVEPSINATALFETILRYDARSISKVATVVGAFLRDIKQKDFNTFIDKMKSSYVQQNKIYEYEQKQIEKANELFEESLR